MTSPHDQPLSRREARRALEADHAGVAPFAEPLTEGPSRSATSWGTPSSAPADMTYRTQVRPRVPQYDERTVSAAPEVSPFDPTWQSPPPVAPAAMPEHDVERVRRRDFRPPVDSNEPSAHAAPLPLDSSLEYHTQVTHSPDVPTAAAPDRPPRSPLIDDRAAAPEFTRTAPLEQTLTRRELRELRSAQQAGEIAPAPGEHVVAPMAPIPRESSQIQQVQPVHLAPILIEPVLAEPELVHPAPVEHAPAVPTSTGSHWSTGIHDDEDPFENTFSREVGSATSLNANALVLPVMPTGSIAGPVTGTGEIIVTGMFAVSPFHASTGAVPSVHDSPDLDDLFDGDDFDGSAPDSAPVSALKAISSHTSSHAVMTGKRSSSNTITAVLVASTVGMAVIAIGLFVVAAANGLF